MDHENPGTGSTSRWPSYAALVAGLVAAATVPLDRPGVGWLIAAATTGAAIWVGSRGGGGVGSIGPRRLALLLASAALFAVGALRGAGWSYAPCVVAAVLLVSQALSRPTTTWTGQLRAALAVPIAAVRTIGWLPGEVRATGVRPTVQLWRLLASVAASAVLAVVFGALFASADRNFAAFLADITPEVTPVRAASTVLLFVLAALATLGGARVLLASAAHSDETPPAEVIARRVLARAEWGIPLAVLDVLFAAFIWVQIGSLFGGRHYVLSKGGPDFTVYARFGFWQLTLVTVLSLAVVAVVGRFAALHDRADRIAFRFLAGALCLLSAVVVASALYRMSLYVNAYGFTRLRLSASAAELLLGFVFVALLIAGVRLGARWLPTACVALAIVVGGGLVAANPDAYVAHTIIKRYKADGHLDVGYLRHLSSDAYPEIDQLPEPLRSCVLRNLAADLRRPDPWYAYNASREHARRELRKRPIKPDASCVQFNIPQDLLLHDVESKLSPAGANGVGWTRVETTRPWPPALCPGTTAGRETPVASRELVLHERDTPYRRPSEKTIETKRETLTVFADEATARAVFEAARLSSGRCGAWRVGESKFSIEVIGGGMPYESIHLRTVEVNDAPWSERVRHTVYFRRGAAVASYSGFDSSTVFREAYIVAERMCRYTNDGC